MDKRLQIMTAFGSVPYEAVKKYLPKESVRVIEANKENILYERELAMILNLTPEEYYIHKLAEKKGWEPRKMKNFIDNLTKFSPMAAANILLREIAIDFDDNHEGHIEESEEIWTISMINGKVEQVDKSKVKNYKNFPAFRSKEDAVIAHAFLSGRLRKMFRGCGK